jgi:hypothetical protein
MRVTDKENMRENLYMRNEDTVYLETAYIEVEKEW